MLFNQLRFFIDYHQLTKNEKLAERERLTKYVRDELQNFSRTSSADIKPVNVQPRLNEEMLYAKYMRTDDSVMDDEATRSRDHSSANSISDEVKTEPCSEPVSGSDEEKMEVLVEPLNLEQKVYSGPRPKLSSKPASIQSQQSNASNRPGQSLLKPIYQRKMDDSEVSIIRVVRPEVGLKAAEEVERKAPAAAVAAPIESQPAAICLSRLNLKAALFKAKDATKTQATQKRIESPETVAPQPLTVKCDVPLSLSQSSNASSSSSVESELLKTETDPVILGQEGFLRMLGLVTPAYSEFVMNRRPQRKKRMCTSTERGDFHYGKSIELFERQFSKRNNRQFLYSPPATRAKRRIGSNGSNPQAKVTTTTAPKRSKGIKKTSSSSSSISSNGSTSSERVCLICHKNSKFEFLAAFDELNTHL